MMGYFEGWYFKQQAPGNGPMLALIPAVHMDGGGHRTGSIQIVAPDGAWCVKLPEAPVYTRRPVLTVKAGGNFLSERGLALDIRQKDITLTGEVRFGPLTKPRGDIMGPYRFVPFMECRHSVFSLTHSIWGSLTLNGQPLDFTGGCGYIEGDRGRSFPNKYAWTQAAWPAADCSVMLSVAEVCPFGAPFMGVIGIVYFQGVQHRLATYRGAKLVSAGDGRISVRQGDCLLTAQLLEADTAARQSLRAPVSGNMVRVVRERLRCRARYTFSVKDRVLFDDVTESASFEYEL
jgi:tocopherol cyclase